MHNNSSNEHILHLKILIKINDEKTESRNIFLNRGSGKHLL